MSDYAFDPDFRALLPMLPTLSDLSTPENIHAIRNMRGEMFPAVAARDDIVREDRRIPGPDGAPEVPVRVYRRKDASASTGPRAGLLEVHGGGFVMGSIEMMDGWCDQTAAELDCVIVSVEYRLAPEDPFPAGVEDCYAALCWMAQSADALGIDSARIAIAGQSAGGGLAAGTAILARDRGGPGLCFQLLEIPELDDRLETSSMRAFTDTPLWNRPNAEWSWKHYLGTAHGGDVSPVAAPARLEDAAGLPPAYISTMEFDPLRDEGIEYALKLLAAGVSVELHSFPGTFHGSAMIPTADASKRNSAEVQAVLRRRLAATIEI